MKKILKFINQNIFLILSFTMIFTAINVAVNPLSIWDVILVPLFLIAFIVFLVLGIDERIKNKEEKEDWKGINFKEEH